MRRNLYTAWLNYKKVFSSISHSWLIRALKLLKLPKHLITDLKIWRNHGLWNYNLTNDKNESISSDLIEIMKIIYEGDSLSVILFLLLLNPLSNLLQHIKSYAYRKNRRQQHTHNFFVDDLKLYSTKLNNIKHQTDTLTTFLNR